MIVRVPVITGEKQQIWAMSALLNESKINVKDSFLITQ